MKGGIGREREGWKEEGMEDNDREREREEERKGNN